VAPRHAPPPPPSPSPSGHPSLPVCQSATRRSINLDPSPTIALPRRRPGHVRAPVVSTAWLKLRFPDTDCGAAVAEETCPWRNLKLLEELRHILVRRHLLSQRVKRELLAKKWKFSPPHIRREEKARGAGRALGKLQQLRGRTLRRRPSPCLGVARADTDNPVYQIEINE